MTEEQIERRVERKTDLLDLTLIAGTLSQPDYDAAIRALNKWAEDQYERMPRR